MYILFREGPADKECVGVWDWIKEREVCNYIVTFIETLPNQRGIRLTQTQKSIPNPATLV
jgi:hypothetical protein